MPKNEDTGTADAAVVNPVGATPRAVAEGQQSEVPAEDPYPVAPDRPSSEAYAPETAAALKEAGLL